MSFCPQTLCSLFSMCMLMPTRVYLLICAKLMCSSFCPQTLCSLFSIINMHKISWCIIQMNFAVVKFKFILNRGNFNIYIPPFYQVEITNVKHIVACGCPILSSGLKNKCQALRWLGTNNVIAILVDLWHGFFKFWNLDKANSGSGITYIDIKTVKVV